MVANHRRRLKSCSETRLYRESMAYRIQVPIAAASENSIPFMTNDCLRIRVWSFLQGRSAAIQQRRVHPRMSIRGSVNIENRESPEDLVRAPISLANCRRPRSAIPPNAMQAQL